MNGGLSAGGVIVTPPLETHGFHQLYRCKRAGCWHLMLYKHTRTDEGCPRCRGLNFVVAVTASDREMEWAIRHGFDPRLSGTWSYTPD